MFDHVGLNVADLETSRRFFEQALAPLGYRVVMDFSEYGAVGFGTSDDKPEFWVGARDPRERLGEGRGSLQLDVAPGERPRREMDVRVSEAREDAPSAQVDHVRARQCDLVRSDAAGDVRSGDGQRSRRRERRVHRADDAVLEDHAGDCIPV